VSFIARFRETVASGRLVPDHEQDFAAEQFEILECALDAYRPTGLFSFARPVPPKGLYLWGDVGRGKSMLMDMFFAEISLEPKRRVHFNAFMTEVHGDLHEERKRGGTRDPILPVAERIAKKAALLCFDEFQVSDVADAMILGRLFEHLFEQGCVVVATSNTAPSHLYEGGLNRQLFVPFIALIEERMNVVGLNGDRDHRRGTGFSGKTYFTPLDRAAREAMDASWRAATNSATPGPDELTVFGRTLHVPMAAGDAARFAFADLCARPLAAPDYLAIARAYRTIFIDAIPKIAPAQRDEARRFMLLIDTLYDEGVALVCSAQAMPDALYPEGDGAQAFRRTASRLVEMTAGVERKAEAPS